jgi:hypothetical protein
LRGKAPARLATLRVGPSAQSAKDRAVLFLSIGHSVSASQGKRAHALNRRLVSAASEQSCKHTLVPRHKCCFNADLTSLRASAAGAVNLNYLIGYAEEVNNDHATDQECAEMCDQNGNNKIAEALKVSHRASAACYGTTFTRGRYV